MITLLCYAGQRMAALWPDTAMQTLADYSLFFADPLGEPLLTALVTTGALQLCTGRIIPNNQGKLAKTIVFLLAALVYSITACRIFLG